MSATSVDVDVRTTSDASLRLGGGVSIFGFRLLLGSDDFYLPAMISFFGELPGVDFMNPFRPKSLRVFFKL
jgi:hypothetical protein